MTYELYRFKMRRFFSSLLILTSLLTTSLILSISVGTSPTPIGDVFSCFFRIRCDGITESIFHYRLVRTSAAFFAGGMLAIAGIAIQGIARNPLAEPYILGLSSTALTAITIALLVDANLLARRDLIITTAFLGALSGYFLTSTISLVAGSTPMSLILSGIAVTAFFSGISHVLLYMIQDRLKFSYVNLLMGSTSGSLLSDVYLLATILTACLTIIYLTNIPKMLNAYVVSDEFVKQLGYNLKIMTLLTAFTASILTGVAVAIIGVVGFIGLAAPHITRLILGTSDHRIAILISAITGSLLAVVADIMARTLSIITARGEFPLGVITSVIGAPFLAYLIVRGGRR